MEQHTEVFQSGIRDKLVGIWNSLGLLLQNWIFINLGACTVLEKVLLQKYNVFLIGLFFMSIFSGVVLAMANGCAF